MSQHPTVVMVIPWLRQYMVTFFRELRGSLDSRGVQFELIYGIPSGSAAGRGDLVDLDWGHRAEQRVFEVGRYAVNWQPYLRIAREADLVIVQQATRDLLNYVLLAHQAFGGPQVAFWGHGRSFLATTRIQGISEAVKRWLTRRSRWFFAYNDVAAKAVLEGGYSADRVTSIGNTLDTNALRAARDAVTPDEVRALKADLGIGDGPVGIYCGAMYPEKRISFLIEAAHELRSSLPGFELVVVGAGIDENLVMDAARSSGWIHHVGPRFGRQLASYFALADVFLLPGAVGLAVIDSFVFETPIVTTTAGRHGPEIAYLESGINGLIVPGDGTGGTFASAVVSLLADQDRYESLIDGAKASVDSYGLAAMVERFADGVNSALSTSR